MLAVIGLVLGMLVGLLTGGSLHALQSMRLRWELPVVSLFLVQAMARGRFVGVHASLVGLSVWVGCNVALLVLLAWDLRIPGIAVIAVGIAMNLTAVLLNGGMPVLLGDNPAAAADAFRASAGFYHALAPYSLAKSISDVMSLSILGTRNILSVGDLALTSGCAALVHYGMSARQAAA